mmetsp:Transcript_9945/g.11034  ORF Transcript_9945/g.11034 Transcript_9945/m.11034 type:complete len:91 (-) Transcript_9945:77-349(-)
MAVSVQKDRSHHLDCKWIDYVTVYLKSPENTSSNIPIGHCCMIKLKHSSSTTDLAIVQETSSKKQSPIHESPLSPLSGAGAICFPEYCVA